MIEEILQTISEFKPKHSLLQEKLLAYFKQSIKHPEIELYSHFKIMFELASDVDSTSVHVNLLSLFNKSIDKNLIIPKNYAIAEEYFRSLILFEKQIITLKMVQVVISMTDKLDNSCLEITIIVKLLSTIVNYMDQITIDKCISRIVRFTLMCNQSSLLNFVKEICKDLQKNREEIQQQAVYDTKLILKIINKLCIESIESSSMLSQQVRKNIIFALIKISKNQQLTIELRQSSISLFFQISKKQYQNIELVLESLLNYAVQMRQLRFTSNMISKILRSQSSQKINFLNVVISEWILSYESNHRPFKKQQSNQMLTILGQMINQVSKNDSTVAQEVQMDQARILLSKVHPILKRLRSDPQIDSKQWENILYTALKLCFYYRIQISNYLELLQGSLELLQNTLNKYEFYLQEQQYSILYRILLKNNWIQFFHTRNIKPQVHLKALQILILKSIESNNSSEILFAIRQIKYIFDKFTDLDFVANVQLACCKIFDADMSVPQKIILEMIAQFLSRSESWFTLLSKLYNQTENLKIKVDILQIINRLLTDSGDFKDSVWLNILLILNQTFQTEDESLLSRTLIILQNIIQQYLYTFNKDLVHKTVKTLVNFPITQASAKDKYKICGLLWVLGQKHKDFQFQPIIKRLTELCLDSMSQVAINGLCIYSQIGEYEDFQNLFQPILAQGKQPVIISFLQNYVKVVRKSSNSNLYERISEFEIKYFPSLYEISSNEIIIESTISHKQLTNIFLQQVFQEPEYFQLTLFFFINYFSEKPKELKLARYSLPKMALQLLNQMVILSSQPFFNSSILVDTCLKLIHKIVRYPMLTNEVFNLDKHKIYFEEIQIIDLLQKFYNNLKQKQLFTPIIRVIPIARQTMLSHAKHLQENQRFSWLQLLGKPLSHDQMKFYSSIFTDQKELQFINLQDWGLREYLITHGKLEGNINTRPNQLTQIDFALCSYDPDDSAETIQRKSILVQKLLQRVRKVFREEQENTLIQILNQLYKLEIHPGVIKSCQNQLKIISKKSHLFYLSGDIIQLALQTQNPKVKAVLHHISKIMRQQKQKLP